MYYYERLGTKMRCTLFYRDKKCFLHLKMMNKSRYMWVDIVAEEGLIQLHSMKTKDSSILRQQVLTKCLHTSIFTEVKDMKISYRDM